jgi:glycosyltransferase involved in cell wall biosynthesis
MTTFLSIHGVFLVLAFFVFLYLKLKQNTQSLESNLDASDVTVIIPFRNESENLKVLFECLRKQKVLPKTIIFSDDHSTDDSVELVEKFLSETEGMRLVQLPHALFGKKQAIRFALSEVSTPFLLTIDADTSFSSDFFEQLKFNSSAAMLVRPVEMKGSSFFGKFSAFEYNFFSAFNYLVSTQQVLNASGANLLIKKEDFLAYDTIANHKHLASGDDYFLLRDFVANKAQVIVSAAVSDKVVTNSVEKPMQYMSQRIRWLAKTQYRTTFSDVLLSVFLVGYIVFHWVVLLVCFIEASWFALVGFTAVRFLLDSFVFFPFAKGLKLDFNAIHLVLFQYVYPLVFIFVTIVSRLWKPNWKGRKV